jgi:hypothetical protein
MTRATVKIVALGDEDEIHLRTTFELHTLLPGSGTTSVPFMLTSHLTTFEVD